MAIQALCAKYRPLGPTMPLLLHKSVGENAYRANWGLEKHVKIIGNISQWQIEQNIYTCTLTTSMPPKHTFFIISMFQFPFKNPACIQFLSGRLRIDELA